MTCVYGFDKNKLVGFIKLDAQATNAQRVFLGYRINKIFIYKLSYGIEIINGKPKFGIKLFKINDRIKLVDINFRYMIKKDIDIYKYINK